MKKILLIILDGLADEPIPGLKGETPLAAAKTPNLDLMAEKGVCGEAEVFMLAGQKKPESDTCHLAIMGFDPRNYYLGRGVYEAAGIGIDLKQGEVALRVNFATIDDQLTVIDRRAGRIEKTQPLIKALAKIKIKGVKFSFEKAYGHRAVLVISVPANKGLSANISGSDPKAEGKKASKIVPLDKSFTAKRTALFLNQFLDTARQILADQPLNRQRKRQGLLPANYLLVRGAGKFERTLSFEEKYHLKASCVAGGGLYKGIARVLGMKVIEVKGATGFADTNLKNKIRATEKALKTNDFVFLHIKATDSLAEDGQWLEKKKFLERVDREMKLLLNLKDTLVVVTGDHATSSLKKRHCRLPCPLLVYGNGRDKIKKFSEKNCVSGKLGRIKQINLMEKILKIA